MAIERPELDDFLARIVSEIESTDFIDGDEDDLTPFDQEVQRVKVACADGAGFAHNVVHDERYEDSSDNRMLGADDVQRSAPTIYDIDRQYRDRLLRHLVECQGAFPATVNEARVAMRSLHEAIRNRTSEQRTTTVDERHSETDLDDQLTWDESPTTAVAFSEPGSNIIEDIRRAVAHVNRIPFELLWQTHTDDRVRQSHIHLEMSECELRTMPRHLLVERERWRSEGWRYTYEHIEQLDREDEWIRQGLTRAQIYDAYAMMSEHRSGPSHDVAMVEVLQHTPVRVLDEMETFTDISVTTVMVTRPEWRLERNGSEAVNAESRRRLDFRRADFNRAAVARSRPRSSRSPDRRGDG